MEKVWQVRDTAARPSIASRDREDEGVLELVSFPSDTT